MGEKIFIFLAVFLLLSCSVLANNDTDFLEESFGLESDDSIEGIVPPSTPNIEDMAKSALGQKNNVFIAMQDVNSEEILQNVHVNYEVISNKEKSSSLQFVGEESFLELRLDPGTYRIILKIDDLDTEGYDYYASETFLIDEDFNTTVDVFPVGSARGTVKSKKGVLTSGVNLKFECSKQYGDDCQKTTDNFGSFSGDYLPVGTCIITASNNFYVGSETILVEHGKTNTIEIVLDSPLSPFFAVKTIMWLSIIAIIILLALLFYFIKNKKKIFVNAKKTKDVIRKVSINTNPEENKKEDKEKIKKSLKVSNRATDIIKTLNPREQEIVNFLLDCKQPCMQNKVIHNTGIPKTSIVRILEKLEGKNIITLQKIGKTKKIGLTSWFLEKE